MEVVWERNVSQRDCREEWLRWDRPITHACLSCGMFASQSFRRSASAFGCSRAPIAWAAAVSTLVEGSDNRRSKEVQVALVEC